MTRYVQFRTPDGALLVEVEPGDAPPTGVTKGGLTDRAQELVADAHDALDTALGHAVRVNAQAVVGAVRALPDPPSEVTVTFGLKVTGEAGAFAVAKAGGEANYVVTMRWQHADADALGTGA